MKISTIDVTAERPYQVVVGTGALDYLPQYLADVQRVARQYFNDDSLTVGLLEPQPLADAPRRRADARRGQKRGSGGSCNRLERL